jgi:hypothetical protein
MRSERPDKEESKADTKDNHGLAEKLLREYGA